MKVSSPTAKVFWSSLLISISAKSSSLQAAVKTKPSVAPSPGSVSGRITRASAPQRAAAVDHRRILQLGRDAVEEGLHQEAGEGHVEGGVDDDQPEQVVGQAERRHEPVDRRDHHDQREHLRQQHANISAGLPRKAKREKA
jgi:hypothetical protein